MLQLVHELQGAGRRKLGGVCAAIFVAQIFCVAGASCAVSDTSDPQVKLEHLLEDIRREVPAPAWAAAIIKDGKIVAEHAVGVRDLSAGTPVDASRDRFHWGSVTKSATGTMLAALVQDGVLRWDMTLEEVFPEVPMNAAYRTATLADLMAHRAKLPSYTRFRREDAERMRQYKGTALEKRAGFVRDVLMAEPVDWEEQELVYSNAGPVVAAHVAEVKTGVAWESLVAQHIFNPAGMKNAGFGWPASHETPDQTRGYYGPDADNLQEMGLDPLPMRPMLSPSGNIHSTIGDFARYALLHLDGLAGRNGDFNPDTLAFLHTAPDDGMVLRGLPYAIGWIVEEYQGFQTSWHGGSAGSFVAYAVLYPEEDLGIVLMTNAGFPGRDAQLLIPRIRDAFLED